MFKKTVSIKLYQNIIEILCYGNDIFVFIRHSSVVSAGDVWDTITHVCAKNANRKAVQSMRTDTSVGVENPHVVRTLPGNFHQVDGDND